MLVKFACTRKDEWDTFCNTCMFAYNAAKHESSLYSPFELMFGRKAVLPIEIDIEKKDTVDLLEQYKNTSKSEAVSTLVVFCHCNVCCLYSFILGYCIKP